MTRRDIGLFVICLLLAPLVLLIQYVYLGSARGLIWHCFGMRCRVD